MEFLLIIQINYGVDRLSLISLKLLWDWVQKGAEWELLE
jgi:hypothetical protein